MQRHDCDHACGEIRSNPHPVYWGRAVAGYAGVKVGDIVVADALLQYDMAAQTAVSRV